MDIVRKRVLSVSQKIHEVTTSSVYLNLTIVYFYFFLFSFQDVWESVKFVQIAGTDQKFTNFKSQDKKDQKQLSNTQSSLKKIVNQTLSWI